jgi:hypothetical protein
MAQQQKPVDLEQLFGAVLGNLRQNRQNLNAVDEYNHDHGDNMVATFSTISRAMRQTRGAEPADRLDRAAGMLRTSGSGSAQMYSRGLSQASKDFEGRQVTSENAMTLIQDLLGGGKPAPAQQQASGGMGDLLGTLLGGGQNAPAPQQGSGGAGDLLGSLFGGGQSAPAPQQQSSGGMGDLLGSLFGSGQSTPAPQQQSSGGMGDLLGSILGGGQSAPSQQQDNGLDTGDLLRAGMAFMSARARGAGALEALVSAVVAASAMGSGYREQSSTLVVNSLLSVLQGMAGGR